MNTPQVSVVIAAFNAAPCIARSIASVQAQTLQSFEIIVIDDGSADNTVAIVQDLATKDSRIKLTRLEQNCGPSIARNKGFQEARGTWIAVLDADDAFKPERLEKLISAAAEYGLGLVADNLAFFDWAVQAKFGSLPLETAPI